MDDPSPPRRWSGVLGFAPLVVGCAVAALLLSALASSGIRDGGDLGLGANTVAMFESVDGDPVHCQDLDPDPADRNVDLCLDAAVARSSSSYALWLGNSQVHGVNRPEEGDSTAAQMLHRAFARRGVDLVTLSQPNANLQEHYVVFEYVRDVLPRLDYLVLPVVFDDTREDGVRDRLGAAFARPGVREALAESELGNGLVEAYGATSLVVGGAGEGATPSATDADFAALDETVQETSETWLNDRLSDEVDLWERRPGMRAALFEYLYLARNSALGIDPSTVRPLIPGPYAANVSALEALLESAARGGVEVLVYVAPIRNDTDIPYRPAEYARFKEEVAALAEAHGAEYVNLEGIVPGPAWGMKASTNLSGKPEYDFMHFTAEGHGLLADALWAEMAPVLNDDASVAL